MMATKIVKNRGIMINDNYCCILKKSLYLCSRFTSKVWIKAEIYLVINTVIDV